MEEILLEKLTWEEVKQRLQETDIVLVPVGSTEQHGPHLPINNDTFTAYELAKRIAEEAWKQAKSVVAPAIPYGVAKTAFPGCITLSSKTAVQLYKEVATSLITGGFNKIIFINGHGGNILNLKQAIAKVLSETDALVALIQYWELGYEAIQKHLGTEDKVWGHAGEVETSISWALGQDVRAEKKVKSLPPVTKELQEYYQPIFRPKVRIYLGLLDPKMEEWLNPQHSPGVIGDPTLANPEKGEKLLQPILRQAVEFIRRLSRIKVKQKEG